MKIMPSHKGKRAIIRSGDSVLHGRLVSVGDASFLFRVEGTTLDTPLMRGEWDAEVSLLPTDPGIYAVLGNEPASSRIFKLDRVRFWTELTSPDRNKSVADYLERQATHYDWTLVPLVPKGS